MTTQTLSSSSPATLDVPCFHTAGIGAGPANLSLAALYQSAIGDGIALFDKRSGPSWHAELLHPGVRMQTSWLKDLVSLVDPTHKLSFLNYLVSNGRLFALLNAQFDFIPRREYMEYLTWAAHQISNIHYATSIERISLSNTGFLLHAGGRPIAQAQHLILGVGTRPVMPDAFSWLPPDRVFVADYLGQRLPAMSAHKDAPVAVVGGGQTGVECVIRLLNAGFTDVRWLGRRQWFVTIDDSPSANEFYRPAHQRFLQELSRPTRRRLVEEQWPTGDALTPGVLRALYQANYDRMLELGRFPVTLLPGRDVRTGIEDGDEILLECATSESKEEHRVRYAVVTAGRETVSVPFDDELDGLIARDDDGEMVLEPDYSVRWNGPRGHRIFAFNRGRMSHGVTDVNLTLLPVRSAVVLNSMFGRRIFEVRDDLCPVGWS